MPSGSEEYSDNGSSKTRGKIIGKMRDNFRQAKNKGIYLRKVLFQAAHKNSMLNHNVFRNIVH